MLNEERFITLWQRAGSTRDANGIRQIFDRVQGHYRESHRRYHTEAHIEHCLAQFDLLSGEQADAVPIELSLWFHDVIYEIGSPQNEQNSADWFVEVSDNDLSPQLCDQVVRIILATQHIDSPSRHDEQVMVDIDLSSFGLPWEAFLRDSSKVRAEYAHQSDVEFYPVHRAFLHHLLARDRIYFTDFYYDLYEGRARQNIRERLKQIAVHIKAHKTAS